MDRTRAGVPPGTCISADAENEERMANSLWEILNSPKRPADWRDAESMKMILDGRCPACGRPFPAGGAIMRCVARFKEQEGL